MMQPYYLTPAISLFEKFHEVFEKDVYMRSIFDHDNSNEFNLDSINSYSCLFIIGEPGYGKSYLIQQLLDQLPEKTGMRIDCRQFADNNYRANFDGVSHIYYDGLDEVPPLLFLESLKKIKELRTTNPEKKIFVACRTHYIKKFDVQVIAFHEAKFLQLQPFQEYHIRAYLSHFLTDHEIIEAIVIRSTSSIGRKSVLQTPRYLAAMVEAIVEGKLRPDEIKTLGRADIFELVIYNQLLTEVKRNVQVLNAAIEGAGDDVAPVIFTYLKSFENQRLNVNEVELTKRVLERLAFIMEIYQRNQITKNEVITFFDDVSSTINQVFLTTCSIDRFIERTLKSLEGDHVAFEHTEFQEYLAAKELIRLSDSPQVLYDLILYRDLEVIYSSWLDVLQYAIELDSEKIAGSLSDYLVQHDQYQTDERLIDILMGTGIERASPETKGKLFYAIFNNYQENGLYLFQKNDALAQLFVPEFNEALLIFTEPGEYNTDTIRRFINQVLIIRSLGEKGSLNDAQKLSWKQVLLSALDKGELQQQYQVILWTLEVLDAVPELKAKAEEMKTKTNEQLALYLETMGRLCGDEMVSFYLEIIDKHRDVAGKEEFLNTLTTKQSIALVFTTFLADLSLIGSVFHDSYRFVSFYRFFDQIEVIDDEELDALLEKLLFGILKDERIHYVNGPLKNFVELAIKHLLTNKGDFLEQFLKQSRFDDLIENYAEVIANTVTFRQFIIVYDALKDGRWGAYALRRVVSQLRIAGAEDRQNLLKEVENAYPEFLAQREPGPEEEQERLKQEKERLRKELEVHLMPGVEYYRQDLFQFYVNNRAKLEGVILADEITYIKSMLTNVIDQVEPETYHVKLDRNGNSVTYNVHNDLWFRFGFFIHVAMELGLDDVLNRNRLKLIKYLPLMNEYMVNENDRLTRLLSFLEPISDEEQQALLTFCTERKDDYIFSSASTFAQLIASKKLYTFKPLLKQLIASELSDYNDKIRALSSFGELSSTVEDRQYLEQLFGGHDENNELKKALAEEANSILIRQYKDQKAIDWRFTQLIAREKPYPIKAGGDRGPRPYPDWEQELDKPTFTAVFDGMIESGIQDQMEKLLRRSLEIRKKQDFIRYSNYLQNIVFNYFVKIASLPILNNLRAVLNESTYKSTAGSFRSYLRKLEISFTQQYLPFNTISEPIKRFNTLKQRYYLAVRDVADLAAVVDAGITDLEDFVINKGYYNTAVQLSGAKLAKRTWLFNEDVLQKTFQVTLENSLLKKGLRDSDILREIELLDGKRLDLVIKYGFIGPVMAELKLLHNTEITLDTERKKYKEKFRQYIAATKAVYAYYIVFKVRNDVNNKDKAAFDMLVQEYSDIPNLTIKLIDCPL